MKFKSLYLIIFAVLMLTQFCLAQDTTGTMQSTGMGYFMFGMNQLDLGELNDKLVANNYAELNENFLALGGGGYGIIKNFIIGGEGFAIIGEDETGQNNYQTVLSGGYGIFDVGYSVINKKAFKLYPMVGFGFGGMSLRIKDVSTTPTFDEAIQDPKRMVELSSGGFLMNFALGFDYLQILGKDEKGEGGIVFGARVGYMFSPIKGDWSFDETDISGGPDLGMTGPYIRFMFGGGGYERK